MSRVVQVRGLPDATHEALSRAAQARGLSLSEFLRRELAALAGRSESVRRNAEVVRATQVAVGAALDSETILSALQADRRE
ncbi:FitA-like ribbon-helix-helix domain-containing protein [Gordonia sp. (in: high G+C Gram-positive bacteria)]|uniref:FitA-like ribbon-helix-helix domain-containing protein n=1 Tax=Gordonia sp. (in: high G+C Gram-positive bacteria) TaxID=84139 RepID=UPI0039E24DA2